MLARVWRILYANVTPSTTTKPTLLNNQKNCELFKFIAPAPDDFRKLPKEYTSKFVICGKFSPDLQKASAARTTSKKTGNVVSYSTQFQC